MSILPIISAKRKSSFSVKKEFNEEEYQKIKQEVDLTEEMEQKLKEDSSQFGLGYGVEYGKDYIIYTIDSITGEEVYRETHRGSGAQDASDGIQPDARSYSKNQRAFKKELLLSEKEMKDNV